MLLESECLLPTLREPPPILIREDTMIDLTELRQLVDAAQKDYEGLCLHALASVSVSKEPGASDAMRVLGGCLQGSREFSTHLINKAREDDDA